MQVVRAEAMGMCFGVRDAIAATEAVSSPSSVTIYGELVHNEQVTGYLAGRGFPSHKEVSRTIPETPAVMITAHGVSNAERSRLAEAGKEIIDTTCPLVRRAHDAAVRAEADGWHVVIAGKRNHVEVLGLTGDLADYTIVQSPEEATVLNHDRIGIVCQTTMQPAMAEAILIALEEANPGKEIRLFDTICRPTRDRQSAMTKLVNECEAVVVVGGAGSNNTLQLVRFAEKHGRPVVRVQTADELDDRWLRRFRVVGLTAGTSTPDSVIDQVAAHLEELKPLTEQPAPRLPDGLVPSSVWVDWFEWNAHNQTEFPWDDAGRIPVAELTLVAESLQEFQRGESSEGRHFLSRGFHHAMRINDPDYFTALTLFIAEENRHGRYLDRFLEQSGVPLLASTPGDSVFRALRKIGGLEGAICILLTAEIIACTYYRAVGQATGSDVLKGICRQILHDEYKHLRFQNERLMILRQNRPEWMQSIVCVVQGILLAGAIVVIWPKHQKAIMAGGYRFGSFFRETFAVFFRHIVNRQFRNNVSVITAAFRKVLQ